MADLDQRGINNQRSHFVAAARAARLLDVKLQTLYAYASRGLLHSLPSGRGRGRLYALEDLRRLKARRDARRGHGAVAAAALDFGAPVLDSAITRIDRDGPYYRGVSAVEMARTAVSFETAIGYLWTEQHLGQAEHAAAELGGAENAVDPALAHALSRAAGVVPAGARPLDALATLLAIVRMNDPNPAPLSREAELPRAHALIRTLAAALQLGRARKPAPPKPRLRIAELVCGALGAKLGHAHLIDSILVLLADHELSASTFAVRVAASTRADLCACLSTGLASLSGSLHSGYCQRVEAMVLGTKQARHAYQATRERARLGQHVPGFGIPGVGHPLYPGNDPRGAFLLECAYQLAPRLPSIKIMKAMAAAMTDLEQPGPVSDFGLVALCMAMQLPPGSAVGLFALSRTAGWVAHVLEQRTQGVMLRPRARYIGA